MLEHLQEMHDAGATIHVYANNRYRGKIPSGDWTCKAIFEQLPVTLTIDCNGPTVSEAIANCYKEFTHRLAKGKLTND